MTVSALIRSLCLAIMFSTLVRQAGATVLLPPPNPCQRFSEPNSVIFRGTVLDVAPASQLLPPRRESVSRIKMSVDEPIRDASRGELVVVATEPGPEPVWPNRGHAYLVYAKKRDGYVWVSQWIPLDQAHDDLALLRPTMRRGTVVPRLYGAVVLFESALRNTFFDQRPVARLSGIKVVATQKPAARDATSTARSDKREDANARFETTTDRNGAFRFLGLAPGTYDLHANVPEPLQPLFPQFAVATKTLGTCAASADLAVTARSVVGTVRAHDGTAVSGATVVVVDATSGAHVRSTDTLSSDGHFNLRGVPDGRYFIGVNVFRPPTANSPYPPTWYPTEGVAGREAIEVSRTRPPVSVDLVLPRPLSLWTFRGRVTDPSGQPVSDAVVCLVDEEYPEIKECRIFAGPDGTFSAQGVVGRRVRAIASSLNPPRQSETVEVSDSAVAAPVTIALTKRLPDLVH